MPFLWLVEEIHVHTLIYNSFSKSYFLRLLDSKVYFLMHVLYELHPRD